MIAVARKTSRQTIQRTWLRPVFDGIRVIRPRQVLGGGDNGFPRAIDVELVAPDIKVELRSARVGIDMVHA